MKVIKLQKVEAEPASEDVVTYPDFLIGALLQKGMGRIEADRAFRHDGIVDFVFTSSDSSSTDLIGSINDGFFRPMLARFGVRCGVENLYGGHTLFACEHEYQGSMRLHRFSLFVCNQNAMGFWMKLYLYSIDGAQTTLEEQS